MKDYQYFTVNDFVDDAGFRNYVLRKEASDVAIWAQWIAENTHKKELIAEAEKLVLLFAAQTPPSVSSTEISQEWQKLWSRIETQPQNEAMEQPVSAAIVESISEPIAAPILHALRGGKRRWLWAAAASVALLATAFLFFPKNTPPQYLSISEAKTDTFQAKKEKTTTTIDFSDNAETVIKTPFGKTQAVTLPDGSTVLLNANSQLRFSENWSKTETRMVWLTGEAEFLVKHNALSQGVNQKFIVHTEGVNVEVIGTRFNLMSRGEKCKLALYEGKVELQLTKHPEQENISITPNEVVQIDKDVVRISAIKKVEVYQAWTKEHFEFDDTPLSEVALLVENTYGITFVFKENALKTKRLTASIPDDDVAILVKIIANIFNIKAQQNGKEIIFDTKN